jgi:hypothetical protein
LTHRLPPLIDEEFSGDRISVPVVNSLNHEVEFVDIRALCSCTGAELRTMKLAAGAETMLDIFVNLRGRTGAQQFNVYLTDTAGRNWHVRVEIPVYQRMRFVSPLGLMELGLLEPESPIERDVIFEAFAGKKEDLPAQIEVVPGGDLDIRVAVGESTVEEIDKAIWVRRFPVHLSTVAPKTPGAFGATLVACDPAKPAAATTDLRINGCTKSLYQISPQYVFFNQAPIEANTRTTRLLIRRMDGEAVSVSTVESPSESVTGKIEPCGGDRTMAFLVLKLNVPSVTKPIWGEIIVRTDHPKQPSFKVQYAASPEWPAQPEGKTR